MTTDERHPEYGPCDGFGPGRTCSQCERARFDSEESWLVWLRSDQPAAPTPPDALREAAPHELDAIACCVRYLRSGGTRPSGVQIDWAWDGITKCFPPLAPSTPTRG